MWWFHPWCADTKKMSYNDSAFYVAETNRKNRLKAPLKPFVGILSGRNAPLIKSGSYTALVNRCLLRILSPSFHAIMVAGM
jgi:hypothetical protein